MRQQSKFRAQKGAEISLARALSHARALARSTRHDPTDPIGREGMLGVLFSSPLPFSCLPSSLFVVFSWRSHRTRARNHTAIMFSDPSGMSRAAPAQHAGQPSATVWP